MSKKQTTQAVKQAKSNQNIALINARVIDPESGNDFQGGLIIENEIIADVSAKYHRNAPKGAQVINCGGHVLSPGLIDMLVFTGEPGQEHRETLSSASRAAAAGGVTSMIFMPNTEPVIDDVAMVDFMQRRARDTAIVNSYVMAAATIGLKGEQMTEIGLLDQAGAVALTNGQKSIANAQLMRHILTYAKDFNALLVHFTEDPSLAAGGVMNESEVATRLGLPGIPAIAETILLERDMQLVALTGGRYHAAQLSVGKSVDILKKAKAKGLPVSGGVSINHLALNENDIGPYRSFLKLKPPLRSEEDRRAMIEGLKGGFIDVIVSGHDPQDAEAKRHPFEEASYGAVGLETLLPAALRLYHNKEIELILLLRAMTCNPATILGLPQGRLKPGSPADLILFDPDSPWIIDRNRLQSRSKNSPFDEARVQGRVLRTFVNGRQIHHFENGRQIFDQT